VAFIPIYDGTPLRNIRRPWVAWGLIVVNVVVFFLVESGGFGSANEASVYTFGLIPAVVSGAELSPSFVPTPLTLITYSFLHGDFWHLLGNMVFLWVLADNIEDALGHVRYLLFYLLCAAGAGYAYVLSAPDSAGPLIGASGAIAGTISAYLILHPRARIWVLVLARIPLRLTAFYVLGFWVVFQLLAVFFGGESNIAWWSHLGGIACGAVLVVLLRKPGTPLFGRGPASEVTVLPAPGAAPVDDAAAPPLRSPPQSGSRGPWE
jgi:membrane associated rhomboid family serine protease